MKVSSGLAFSGDHRRQNRRCVTPLVLGTVSRWKRSSSSVGAVHKRSPRPISIGATATCIVSTRSASRTSRIVVTPPPSRTSLPSAACLACCSASAGVALRKWNVVSDRVKRRALVMGQHEHRRVERRRLAPPALPVLVGPRPALGAELVATHDLGADVVGVVAGEVVVESSTAAGLGAVRPACGGSGPLEQVPRVGAVPEGALETLIDAGAIPVAGNAEALNSQQLCHSRSFFGRSSPQTYAKGPIHRFYGLRTAYVAVS